jgi:HEAT repeat protein
LKRLRADAEPAVVALADALTDADLLVRVRAAEALGWIGEGAKAAVPALLRVVKEERSTSHSRSLPDVRLPAAGALGSIGDARPDVVAALAELTKDRWVQTYGNEYDDVAYALGRLGPEAKAAVPVLVEQLQDKNHRWRAYVLRALQGIGPGAGAAVPALIRVLEDEKESMDMRVNAALTLSRIGAAAKEAIPALGKVRDRYRHAPQEEAEARTLSDTADSAIAEIQRAELRSPADPKRTGENR